MDMRCCRLLLALLLGVADVPASFAAEPPPPIITNFNSAGSQRNLRFAPYPGAQAYTLLSTTNLNVPFAPDLTFTQSAYFLRTYTNGPKVGTNYGFEWRSTNSAPGAYYRVGVTPIASNDLLMATALNRLAYGPTPDELARVRSLGPQVFIDEQLAPWSLAETVTAAHTNFPRIEAKFAAATDFVQRTNASIHDLRAWHVLRAVGARRQLLEILLQFFENHFVTEYDKTYDWFDKYYDDSTLRNGLATQTEHRENNRWRAALLDPQCTFLDLLKISAESPAMIIYLDTAISRGDGKNVANENYARELLELFTFGVDNGYDQDDLTVMSRAWTGWRVDIVDLTNVFHPLAGVTTNTIPWSTNTSTTTKSNLYGAWAFNYQTRYHNASNKTIFPGKVVPARFGAPWAGTSYQLVLSNGSSTNGIQDGYQALQHLADQPFTAEYLSVKLCRLFVHEGFPNPSSDPADPAYAFYDYASGNLSPEADLVYQCLLTWQTNSPKGQIWAVLRTIFDSELFRSHGAAQQKVKTPLELTVSAIRALRSSTNGSGLAGTFTADTDGYAIGGTSTVTASPLARMGNMKLFDRDAPDGYPEFGPSWISAGTLAERIRFVQSFCIAAGQHGHSGDQRGTTNDAAGCVSDVVRLVKAKLPAGSWGNAEAVADFFLDSLYPGEGAANLALYREAAVKLLNDGSADVPASSTSFASLTVSGTAGSAYDTRVRGMVAFLMGLQRFQEQ